MLAKIASFSISGIEAYPVEIEVDVSQGLPVINLVGLADAAIRESRQRVKSAIKNSGFRWPTERITVNLAPSGLKKEGAGFDLAIALGVLAASQQINSQRLGEYFFIGELSLEGRLRPVRGALPASIALAGLESAGLVCPFDNGKEATLIPATAVWPLKTLRETVEFLNTPSNYAPWKSNLKEMFDNHCRYPIDFCEVKGQYLVKRALEIAVSGGHNILTLYTQYTI